MFRPATIKEVECLLSAQGKDPHLAAAGVPVLDGEDDHKKAYKHRLTEAVRESMIFRASKYLLSELQDEAQREALVAGTGLGFSTGFLAQGTSCIKDKETIINFVRGVLWVLDRDFVQLTHGKGAKLLQNRVGVQFLLTGSTLGLLYESLPEKEGVDEIVLQVLIIMLDPRAWTRALELYGPAPPDAPPMYQPRGHKYRKNRSMSARGIENDRGGAARSGSERSGIADETPFLAENDSTGRNAGPAVRNLDPTVCSECKRPFEHSGMVHECDCGAVTIQYRRARRPQRITTNVDGSDWRMEEDDPIVDRFSAAAPARPRAHSV